MKKDIHPAYADIKVHCSCGNKFVVRSTGKDTHLDVCSECHPFYTGKQKIVDTARRVEGFEKKFAFIGSSFGKLAEKSSQGSQESS
ncbi:MAG: 50S ribosomal protein L31 [Gammaproteobacteria bacterium]|nr:50S ribosomal protein L31 [Gammaproteobacteria bacterium]MCD8525134.1 50S ribosomal protein L31 [Gammaproteobacteria bacterium]MCD8542080.1 50S ribosomal protein L31 [Gammaproteobacteria bacterium]